MAADYRKIVAIVRVDQLEHVEKALQDLHVSGVSVSRVKGYGEYTDFFARDWMSAYARIEIFTGAEHADRIVSAIVAAASTGTPGDGIVAVESVASVLRIRSGSRVPPDEI
jgi:nitrogen regulatory protein P-II 1